MTYAFISDNTYSMTFVLWLFIAACLFDLLFNSYAVNQSLHCFNACASLQRINSLSIISA